MYVQCFRQIVDKNPTPQNYVLLGDAFMAIEEPDKALEIYEQVWKWKLEINYTKYATTCAHL